MANVKLNCDPLHTIGVQTKSPIAMSSDASMYAYVDKSHTVYVCSLQEDSQVLFRLNGNRHDVLAIAFSPNSQFMATAANGTIRIFNLQNQQQLFAFDHKVSTQCHEGQVTALSWASDEILISGGADSDLKCYRITEQDVKQQSNLISDSNSKDKLYLTSDKLHLFYIDGINANKAAINGIAIPPIKSSLISSFSKDGCIKIFNIENWLQSKPGAKALHSLEAHKSEVLCANFSLQAKKLIAGSKDNFISMWDLENGQLEKFFQAHQCDVVMVQFLNNDQYYTTASFDGDFKIWKTDGAQVTGGLNQPNQAQLPSEIAEEEPIQLQEIAVTLQQPDLKKLLKSQQKYTAQEVPLGQFQLHEKEMHFCCIALKKPVMISCQQTQFLRIWDIQNISVPKIMREVFSHVDQITSVLTIDQQSKTVLLSSSDGLFSLMNVQKASKLLIQNVGCGLLSCSYSQQKSLVFAATQLYEVVAYFIQSAQKPQKAFILTDHTAAVNEVISTNDFVISGSADGYVHLYKLGQMQNEPQKIKPLQKKHDHDGFITAMAFFNNILVTAGSDHKLCVYQLGNNLKMLFEIEAASAAFISGIYLSQDSIYICSHDSTIKKFSLKPVKNPMFRPQKAVYSGNIEKINEYSQQMLNISSQKCELCAVVPISYGLPNCICLKGNQIVIGTTNGQLMIFDQQLQLIQINDLHDDEQGELVSSVCQCGEYLVCGLGSGTLQVWADKSDKEGQKEVVVVAGK
uniref:WD domain, G-beta repeat-containing protein n=1 Tax=Trepomonas sp. PC1 TaxID=1076344 RepID=A0A146KDH0_9EUKA|eukprot:JAP93964.1 WD domain, G-beta repeat-containing protein [Trepomonas sp. PC1]